MCPSVLSLLYSHVTPNMLTMTGVLSLLTLQWILFVAIFYHLIALTMKNSYSISVTLIFEYFLHIVVHALVSVTLIFETFFIILCEFDPVTLPFQTLLISAFALEPVTLVKETSFVVLCSFELVTLTFQTLLIPAFALEPVTLVMEISFVVLCSFRLVVFKNCCLSFPVEIYE